MVTQSYSAVTVTHLKSFVMLSKGIVHTSRPIPSLASSSEKIEMGMTRAKANVMAVSSHQYSASTRAARSHGKYTLDAILMRYANAAKVKPTILETGIFPT